MKKVLMLLFVFFYFGTASVFAEGREVEEIGMSLDTVWVIVAALLVFFMQPGFALLEAGATRAKNAAHIAGKNILSFSIATLVFWAVGFAIAFGDGTAFFGLKGWFMENEHAFSSLSALGIPIGAKFMFQLAFLGVSLAIMWGGVAERAKLSFYFIFGILFSAIIYPVVAHLVWGGGWLSTLGMQDFAGSTVVHLTGGVSALIAAILLGPRLGKRDANGKSKTILGHNMVYSVVGVFILWFGWFGFNSGSTITTSDSFFAYVAMTTNLAAASGAIFALLVSWIVFKKADISYMLNGVLAALVAITASCAFVEPWAAVIIGAIAGTLMVFSYVFFDRVVKIDDPVGAFSVHGVAGIWGTLSTGLFATPELVAKVGVGKAGLFYGGGLHQLGIQALGVVVAFIFVSIISFVIIYTIKKTIGIRVSEADEARGLDLSEHGAPCYSKDEVKHEL